MTLDNPQHEKFAQLVASGMDTKEAYSQVYPKCTPDSAEASGSRLLGIVNQRVKFIQGNSATETTLTMQERREFLARVVRAKIHEIDFDKDGDLIQEITRIEGTEKKEGIEKYRLPGKRECVLLDAQLSGEMPDKPSMNINLNNQINVVTITEDRRKELIDKRRAANQRLKEMRVKAKELKSGDAQ